MKLFLTIFISNLSTIERIPLRLNGSDICFSSLWSAFYLLINGVFGKDIISHLSSPINLRLPELYLWRLAFIKFLESLYLFDVKIRCGSSSIFLRILFGLVFRSLVLKILDHAVFGSTERVIRVGGDGCLVIY